ncbi:hypothetical protein ACPOL_2199 [Acidisarcina polymorpha]|uniref:Uncharacterized protein n=1 Tax=Acidisarcina polymorpha TaxID=2211140 RepID=A0A2Z5FXB4_9BACT|nr:hypothetical protein ACPOL_2199 [Acidisarcina polymorpha]
MVFAGGVRHFALTTGECREAMRYDRTGIVAASGYGKLLDISVLKPMEPKKQ